MAQRQGQQGELLVLGFCLELEQGGGLLQVADQIHRGQMQLHFALFDFGGVQHLVDEVQQLLGGGGDLVQTVGHLLRLVQVVPGQVGKADNGVHGGAHVVAHAGEKVAFGLVGHTGAVQGFPQHLVFGEGLDLAVVDETEGQNDLLLPAPHGKGLGADPAGAFGEGALILQIAPGLRSAAQAAQLLRGELGQESGPVLLPEHGVLYQREQLFIAADGFPGAGFAVLQLGDLTALAVHIHQGHREVGLAQGLKAPGSQAVLPLGQVGLDEEVDDEYQEDPLQGQLEVENVGGVLGDDRAGDGDDAGPAFGALDVVILVAVPLTLPGDESTVPFKLGHHV